MPRTTSVIDLSTLAAPDIVEQLDLETIIAAMIADLQSRDATFSALVESDPAYKIIEVCAYREYLMRQRVNEACKALLLAYAEKADLDQIGANYDVERLTITPADDDAVPPVAAVMETDANYRARIQKSFEGYSCAGPISAYEYYAVSASGDVKDVNVDTPEGGVVRVVVLSQTGDGTAPQSTLDAVQAALDVEEIRPLCDTVVVQGAEIIPYTVNATIEVISTFDKNAVADNARAALAAYVVSSRAIGIGPSIAGIYAALFVSGARRVILNSPGITADMELTETQAPYCTGYTVTGVAVS